MVAQNAEKTMFPWHFSDTPPYGCMWKNLSAIFESVFFQVEQFLSRRWSFWCHGNTAIVQVCFVRVFHGLRRQLRFQMSSRQVKDPPPHSATPHFYWLPLWCLRHPEPSHAKITAHRAVRGAGTLDLKAIEDLESCPLLFHPSLVLSPKQRESRRICTVLWKSWLLQTNLIWFPFCFSLLLENCWSLSSPLQSGWFSDSVLVL